MKLYGTLLACAAAFAVAAASAAPCAARDIDVRVSTLGVFESKYEGCEARIVTPVVTGLAMDSVEKEINAQLAEKALEMQERYSLEVLELMHDPFAKGAHIGWMMDYKVIDGDERFFTLDVVEMNTNYVKVVSDAVRGEMRRANKKQKGSYWVEPKDDGGFSSIKADQNFYMNKDGNIVVCFDKYEVAPGSSGCPEIELDMKELAPWLKLEELKK